MPSPNQQRTCWQSILFLLKQRFNNGQNSSLQYPRRDLPGMAGEWDATVVGAHSPLCTPLVHHTVPNHIVAAQTCRPQQPPDIQRLEGSHPPLELADYLIEYEWWTSPPQSPQPLIPQSNAFQYQGAPLPPPDSSPEFIRGWPMVLHGLIELPLDPDFCLHDSPGCSLLVCWDSHRPTWAYSL